MYALARSFGILMSPAGLAGERHVLVCASALAGCSAIDSFQAEMASSNSSE